MSTVNETPEMESVVGHKNEYRGPTTKSMGDDVSVHMRAYCKGCRRYHDIHCTPQQMVEQFSSWEYKHSKPGCDITFSMLGRKIPRDFNDKGFMKAGRAPWWLLTERFKESAKALLGWGSWQPNANFQRAFNASSSLTITSWNSLASSSGLTAGASSAVVDNGASATLLDVGIGAAIKGGTTPTVSTLLQLYAWCKVDDSTYPDAITGSDAAITINAQNASAGLNLAVQWPSTTTTGGTYPAGWYTSGTLSLEALSGGFLPRYWGLWLTHSTVAALASSGHIASAKQSYIAG